MNPTSKNIQLQYQGFLNTPLLWKQQLVCTLEQLELTEVSCQRLTDLHNPNIRLGKRVEQFVITSLEQDKNIRILSQNTQINNKKITVGELDCLLEKEGVPIHLEIIYKFYLYDASVGTKELAHWIGPNRNDSLLKKLHKLRDKQLPLLFNEHTRPLLSNLGLKAKDFLQRVCFKAQLFVPYQQDVLFSLLNKECIQGFYVHFSALKQFSGCKFYIPSKIDWLLEVQTQVSWMSYQHFYTKTTVLIEAKTAPLCWIKFPNGTSHKFFVVWWDL
ncbi:MAG: hypothetical protein COB98_07390 [Flavobacteriaceae bacterium]|nr:MAG: hypothetical protein COB98_07390 [Flavobacteriaceae bacterium]